MHGPQHLVLAALLVVLLLREAVGALDLGRAVGAVVGAARERGVEARLGGAVVVGAGDAAALQLGAEYSNQRPTNSRAGHSADTNSGGSRIMVWKTFDPFSRLLVPPLDTNLFLFKILDSKRF